MEFHDFSIESLLGPALAAGVILFFVLLRLLWRRERDHFPFEPRDSLMTETELAFFGILEQALEDSYRIYSKVRLEDIIQVKPGIEKATAFAARNRIKCRHIDFVLCDPETLKILASIELDDRSHERPERMDRDDFVDEALRVCGIPCIRFPVQRNYSSREIRQAVEDCALEE